MTIDMLGERRGKLLVIGRSDKRTKRGLYWICRCDCGNVIEAAGADIRVGDTTSCKCARNERTRLLKYSHGMEGTPTYRSWEDMKKRCYDPSRPYYRHYGGRGIVVCDSWKNSFQNFFADMGERPVGLTLDRVDNDGNYEPSNCRWATRKQQSNNTRRTHFVTVNGEARSLMQWSEQLGISYSSIKRRLRAGWSEEEACTVPKRDLL